MAVQNCVQQTACWQRRTRTEASATPVIFFNQKIPICSRYPGPLASPICSRQQLAREDVAGCRE